MKKKNKKKTKTTYISTKQASELTGLPVNVLIQMRSRETTSLKSGPPFRMSRDEDGTKVYEYPKEELEAWIEAKKPFQLTAKDAADTMGLNREEILKDRRLQRFEMDGGDLLVYPGKNIFLWVGGLGRKS